MGKRKRKIKHFPVIERKVYFEKNPVVGFQYPVMCIIIYVDDIVISINYLCTNMHSMEQLWLVLD